VWQGRPEALEKPDRQRFDGHLALRNGESHLDQLTGSCETSGVECDEWLVEYDHTLGHTVIMSTTERVTVTLSADLVEGIDRLERNRSRFIAEAVEHELTRRRREALLSSVRNPHPETADPVDARLGEWTADLPDDEGLVDATGGTAVRWVEGQGWVKESA
jgi:hypothetical protein